MQKGGERMFKCPACGAAHTELPDVCAVCGAPFDAGIPDPFVAAQAQEDKSRAEQEKRRAEYRRRSAAAYQKKDAASPNRNPKEQSVQKSAQKSAQASAKKNAAEQKRRELGMMLTAAAIIAIILLAVYAVAAITKTIRGEGGGGGGGQKAHRDLSYAFYQKDNSLWYYDAKRSKPLCLIEQAADIFLSGELHETDDALASLMRVSEDGSRVYYPKASYHKDTCLLCWRAFDDFNTEHVVSEISLRDINPISSAMWHDIVQGNPNQNKPADFINMMPAYILLGDAVFYRNADEQLCRQGANGEETVLASKVARFWTVPESNLMYYLMPALGMDVFEYELMTTQIGSSFYEECSVPCQFYTCAEVGAPTALLYSSVCAWSVPETDSARWFHYTSVDTDSLRDEDSTTGWQDADEGHATFSQVDLLHPERSEYIMNCGINMMPLHALRCYPDGSFYYSMRTPDDTSPGILVSYFKRKFDQADSVITIGADQRGLYDVCREEPYLIAQSVDGKTGLFYGSKVVELNIEQPDTDGEAVYYFAYGGTELYRKFQDGNQASLYIGKPNGSEPVTMQKMLGFDSGAVYFGLTAAGSTQYFNWNINGGDMLTACDDRGMVQQMTWGVRFYENPACIQLCPQYGQLYCLGDYIAGNGTLRRWENGRFVDIAETVTAYIPLDAERLYLFSEQSGELSLVVGEDSFCADTDVTRLICAGALS